MNRSINNYINVNINNNNNINVNINNISYYNNNNNSKNKQTTLNQDLISLIKSNSKKFQNKKSKEKDKDENKNSKSIFDAIKINKSRNFNQKSGLCHVKSMDYNNKPLNTDLMGTENNIFYDKTFNNNSKVNNNMNMTNNCQINMSTQGNKLNWNYSYLKMKKIISKRIIFLLSQLKMRKDLYLKTLLKNSI